MEHSRSYTQGNKKQNKTKKQKKLWEEHEMKQANGEIFNGVDESLFWLPLGFACPCPPAEIDVLLQGRIGGE